MGSDIEVWLFAGFFLFMVVFLSVILMRNKRALTMSQSIADENQRIRMNQEKTLVFQERQTEALERIAKAVEAKTKNDAA